GRYRRKQASTSRHEFCECGRHESTPCRSKPLIHRGDPRMPLTAYRTLLVVFMLLVAVRPDAATQGVQPPGWDAGVRLTEITDTNPDPRIVEIDLRAQLAKVSITPETSTEVWTYNGTLPGPLIRTRVGD